MQIKNKNPLIIFCIFITVAIITLFLIAKHTLNYGFIVNQLDNFLNIRTELIKPATNINHKLDIEFNAQKINIYNSEKNKKYISVTNPKIVIKPFGLFVNKINIKKATVEKLEINISKKENRNIDLIEDLNLKNLKSIFNKNKKITKLNLNINDISINYTDNIVLKDKISFDIKNTKAYVSKKTNEIHFFQKGKIYSLKNENNSSDFSLELSTLYNPKEITLNNLKTDVSVKNLNLLIFSDMVKQVISNDIDSINGIMDLTLKTQDSNQFFNTVIKNHFLKLKDNKIIVPYKQNIVIDTIFNIENNNLNIISNSLKSNDLDITSKGIIENIFNKDRKLQQEINISNTQINSLINFIPDSAIFYRKKGIPILKKSNFFGIANGKINLELFPLNITGNLKVENIYIPGVKKASRSNDVNTCFMKDKMRIYTRVYTPDDEYVTIDGISNLNKSMSGKYSVTSTKKIDLSFATKYLVPIQQIIGFNIGPVPIMKITGYGNINIKTQGSIFDAQIFGNFNAYNATAILDGLNAELKNGTCELVFDNRTLIFKKIKGKIKDSDFSLTGKGNTKGEVELKAAITKAKTSTILDIFNNSIISSSYRKLTKPISATSGNANAEVDLVGTIKNYEDKNFLNNLALNGFIDIKDNSIFLINGTKFNSLNGKLNFGNKQQANLEGKIGTSKFIFKLLSDTPLEKIAKNQTLNFVSNIGIPKLYSRDINKIVAPNIPLPSFYTKIQISSGGIYSINENKISNLKNKGYIIGLNDKHTSAVQFKNGLISLNDSKVNFNKLNIRYNQGDISIDGYIDNILNKKSASNINILLKDINLSSLNNLSSKIKTDNSYLKSGKISIKNDNLELNNINLTHNSMPVFFNGQIKNIYTSKEFYGIFSTILTETTTDEIINPYLSYPIKIKGEVPIKTTFKGVPDDYDIYLSANVPIDSDISFSGANLGDTNYKREISGKIEVNKNIAKINNLKLIKYIANQNNKINPLTTLKIDGSIIQKLDSFNYNNFKITTYIPTNVRILNLFFKKSLLKKGNFECEINLNGDIKTPLAEGKILLEDLDIPLYDTKINKILFNITKKYIYTKADANSKDSDFSVYAKAQNNLKYPILIEDLIISSNKIDIPHLLNSISTKTPINDIVIKQDVKLKPQDIIIKKGVIDFKNVVYDKISTQNLKSNFNYKNNSVNIKNISFDIAQGTIEASGNYNVDTTKLKLNADIKDCNSNILAKEFLHLSDQIYGKLNGSIELTGKGLNTPNNIKNIHSKISFSVNNGKMTKLGSLEYLLRAGNLFKSGVLGLSLNNLVQILTPYKTGEFDNISGNISVSNGEVSDIEIKSKGKNLSLYLEGNYDILKKFADIQIYGRLSQNVSNAIGAIANASLKQAIEAITPQKNKKQKDSRLQEKLDKIPTIDKQSSQDRFFKAKVLGDIDKDNYIKSFNWE